MLLYKQNVQKCTTSCQLRQHGSVQHYSWHWHVQHCVSGLMLGEGGKSCIIILWYVRVNLCFAVFMSSPCEIFGSSQARTSAWWGETLFTYLMGLLFIWYFETTLFTHKWVEIHHGADYNNSFTSHHAYDGLSKELLQASISCIVNMLTFNRLIVSHVQALQLTC